MLLIFSMSFNCVLVHSGLSNRGWLDLVGNQFWGWMIILPKNWWDANHHLWVSFDTSRKDFSLSGKLLFNWAGPSIARAWQMENLFSCICFACNSVKWLTMWILALKQSKFLHIICILLDVSSALMLLESGSNTSWMSIFVLIKSKGRRFEQSHDDKGLCTLTIQGFCFKGSFCFSYFLIIGGSWFVLLLGPVLCPVALGCNGGIIHNNSLGLLFWDQGGRGFCCES